MDDKDDEIKPTNSRLLAWAGGVLDAALRPRIDLTSRVGGETYSLRLRMAAKNREVMRAWCAVVDIPFKIIQGSVFIAATEQQRVLELLRPYSVRSDMTSLLNFRAIRRRGSGEIKAAKEIKKEIEITRIGEGGDGASETGEK